MDRAAAAALCAVVVVRLALTLRAITPFKTALLQTRLALKRGPIRAAGLRGEDAGATATVDISSMSYAEAALKVKRRCSPTGDLRPGGAVYVPENPRPCLSM